MVESQDQKKVGVGTGKCLHFHRLQAASLSPWLTSPDPEAPLPQAPALGCSGKGEVWDEEGIQT